MGNHQFGIQRSQWPKNGQIVSIKQSQYTNETNMPASVLHEGSKAKVIKTVFIHQSRPDLPKIAVTTVMLEGGKQEAYLTTNLRF